MSFIEAIAIGIQKANDSERIQKEVLGILLEFNKTFTTFTSKPDLPFIITDVGFTSNCPISIELRRYSWPMVLMCGNTSLEVIGVEDFGLALGALASTATFGDYVKAVMSAAS